MKLPAAIRQHKLTPLRKSTAVIFGVGLVALLVIGLLNFLRDPVAQALQSRIEGTGGIIVVGEESLNQSALLARIYGDNGFQPIWTDGNALLPKSKAFLEFLGSTHAQNWRHGGYHLDRIETLLAHSDAEASGALNRRVELELLLTDAYAQCGNDLQCGTIDPRNLFPGWFCYPEHEGSSAAILSALKSQDLGKALMGLEPSDSGYLLLRKELERHRGIKRSGGWPVVPAGPILALGDRGDRVPLLRKRLLISGDLEPDTSGAPDIFDSGLAGALSRFQMRHELHESGLLDEPTLEGLNVSVEARILQIELNLERLRWLPRRLDQRNIFVNVAACRLELVENDRVILKKRVIVGRKDHKTVLFSGSMRYMEINPYWEVPEKIVINELVPMIKTNPAMLAEKGFRIIDGWAEPKVIKPEDIDWNTLEPEKFEYRIRQEPGQMNPLGCIKFMFPNDFSIYMHDTSERQLFESDSRTFSHGCIRLEQPLEMAAQLLKDSPGGAPEEIKSAVESHVNQKIEIPNPISIYIYYLTAWVDREGSLHFCRDIYNADMFLAGALMDAQAKTTNDPD